MTVASAFVPLCSLYAVSVAAASGAKSDTVAVMAVLQRYLCARYYPGNGRLTVHEMADPINHKNINYKNKYKL